MIATTHSPYIVKELSKANISPIVVKRDEKENVSTITKTEGRVLPYVSMNEMNYIAFDEPTIEYHIELFGYMQNKLKKNVKGLDNWLMQCGIIKSCDLFDWYDTNTIVKDSNKMTLPYCVRNNIDHPLVDDVNDMKKHTAYLNNSQFDNKDLIRKSIEIMRKAIIDNNLL